MDSISLDKFHRLLIAGEDSPLFCNHLLRARPPGSRAGARHLANLSAAALSARPRSFPVNTPGGEITRAMCQIASTRTVCVIPVDAPRRPGQDAFRGKLSFRAARVSVRPGAPRD